MSDYRSEVRSLEKETRWTFARFIPTILLVVLVVGGIGAVTKYLGMWGGTVMERVIFTESYQRSSALEAAIAVDEATLVEIQHKLSNTNLEKNTRVNLEAQASAARVRIATAKSKQ